MFHLTTEIGYSSHVSILSVGSRNGVRRSFAPPELIRPDHQNPFRVASTWNGLIVEVYVRNSVPSQRGNSRSFVQCDEFPRQLLMRGYAVRINDEQGVSGARIESDEPSKNRRVFQGILARIIANESHRIGVIELSRLARDESGLDCAYIKKIVLEHCHGEILTLRKTFNLLDDSDAQEYDRAALVSGWRRQDDAENVTQGFRRYVQDVVAGKRDITMPFHVSFGYKREPVKDLSGNVVVNGRGRVRTRLVLDHDLTEAMHAFRHAAKVHRDASSLARELNAAHISGPDRYRPIGLQWTKFGIRRLIRQDIYAGVWTPLRAIRSEQFATCLIREGFDPRGQCRIEPDLAWFTATELEEWRAKFIQSHETVSRRRNYEHPLLGILACASCSDRTLQTVYLTRHGRQPLSKARGIQNIYSCPNRLSADRCPYSIPEDTALSALASQISGIHDSSEEVARIAECSAGSYANQLRQHVLAKRDRQQWIRENVSRPDPQNVLRNAQLSAEIESLTRELDRLGAQVEALKHAIEAVRAAGGNLQGSIQLLDAVGQGIVYRALIAAAFMACTGPAHVKVHTVRRVRLVAEMHVE